jgi:YVTN family beta-propeller protein
MVTTMIRARWTVFVAVLLCPLFAHSDPYLSPLALVASEDGTTLYIAEHTANQVAVFDVASSKVAHTIALGDPATGVALGPRDGRLYVTGGSPQGSVHIVDLGSGTVAHTLAAGHTPVAPAVSPDGETLYVCNRFNNNVVIIDIATGDTSTVPVGREPVASVLTADGRYLLVANQIPSGASNLDYVAAGVSVIDTQTREVTKTVALLNGSTGLRDICLSPDGRYAYLTHILAHYQLPTTHLERGWMNTNALSVIDMEDHSLVNTVLLDDSDLGAANPWGVACTADGDTLVVAHAGSHEFSLIDREGLHARLAKAAAGEEATPVSSSARDVPADLAFLQGLRRRVPAAVKGLRGIAIAGSAVFGAAYYSDSIVTLDLGASGAQARIVALGPTKALTAERKGEMFFHDADFCFQQWQSCSSCHPGEGRIDGLNWDLLLDGIGNPKNTKSLVTSHLTPPTTARGIRAGAEVSVRAGIKHIQFTVRPDEDAQAIDAYLKSLKPLASPYLVDGDLSAAAQRGKAHFETLKCTRCHPSPLYTNMRKYYVGTGRGMEEGVEFDTPTLLELWRTGPYFHDGRAATIAETVASPDDDNDHGQLGATLTKEDLADLVEYVLSL